jgi:hypothetical protein
MCAVRALSGQFESPKGHSHNRDQRKQSLRLRLMDGNVLSSPSGTFSLVPFRLEKGTADFRDRENTDYPSTNSSRRKFSSPFLLRILANSPEKVPRVQLLSVSC